MISSIFISRCSTSFKRSASKAWSMRKPCSRVMSGGIDAMMSKRAEPSQFGPMIWYSRTLNASVINVMRLVFS